MPLSVGTRLGPYEILMPIGCGGMGEVYRATDTKLGRDVAIKVLPESFALDADRVARFQREAQVLASLNHPNIAAIYGIEQGALIMELVEGENLRGPLPLDTALDYARQLAAALEGRARKGHHASRSEAGQHNGHAARSREGARLRAGGGGADFIGRSQYVAHAHDVADSGRDDPGHGGVHGARAGARQAGR
jgi:serine/threonine protein kinase